MIISKKLETAASAVGKIVKQGVAANGAIACGQNEQALGPIVGSADNETFAVGDHLDIACIGEVAKVLMEGAISAGDNIAVTVGGIGAKMASATVGGITISGGGITALSQTLFRLGVAKTNGVAGDLIEAVITNDFITRLTVV